MKIRGAWFGLVLLFAAAAQAQEIEIQAQLMGALGTQTSHKGDAVYARVIRPDPLKGDIVQGKVTDATSGTARPVSTAAVPPDTAVTTPAPATAVAAPAPAPAAAALAAQGAAQPDLTAVRADFVPGEKVIFYDDFTDMAGDEPPPHWKVRGGSVALKVGAGIRQLTVMADRISLTPNIKGLPKNFTLETEMKFDNPVDVRSVWYIHDNTWESPTGPPATLRVFLQTQTGGLNVQVEQHVKGETEDLGSTSVSVDFNRPVKEAIWIQDGRLRIYINGERIVDVNQVELPPLTGAELDPEFGEGKLGYRMVRIAESTPDFSQVISSSGRYVTHGIYFDTDSDKLKPESAPVIKSIAQGLEKNPNLKLRIEGHTDSTGSAEHNLDLSKRRAQAVKAVLVSQFNVDASRLTTDGLGSTKPIDSNDTPQGRAQNRRVEFVKQ